MALVVARCNPFGERIALVEDRVVVRVAVRIGMSVRDLFRPRGAVALMAARTAGVGARVSSGRIDPMVDVDFLVGVARRRSPKAVSVIKPVWALHLQGDVWTRLLGKLGRGEGIFRIVRAPFELKRGWWLRQWLSAWVCGSRTTRGSYGTGESVLYLTKL